MLGTREKSRSNMREGKRIIIHSCQNHKGASHSLVQCPGGKAKLIYTFVANYLAFATTVLFHVLEILKAPDDLMTLCYFIFNVLLLSIISTIKCYLSMPDLQWPAAVIVTMPCVHLITLVLNNACS